MDILNYRLTTNGGKDFYFASLLDATEGADKLLGSGFVTVTLHVGGQDAYFERIGKGWERRVGNYVRRRAAAA